jgi:hypothetical protein
MEFRLLSDYEDVATFPLSLHRSGQWYTLINGVAHHASEWLIKDE